MGRLFLEEADRDIGESDFFLRSLGDWERGVWGLDGREVVLEFGPFEWDGFPMSDVPTVADCVHYLRFRRHPSVNEVALRTMAAVDAESLSDEERYEWRRFLNDDGRREHVSVLCMALWSAEITEENADSRNGLRPVCLDHLRDHYDIPGFRGRGWLGDSGELWKRSRGVYLAELLDRPYGSLTDLERYVLGAELQKSPSCRSYYPQLFTGRWVPLLPEE